MNTTLLCDKLQNFGLTQYETKAYVALVSNGSANAYLISKISGVPRARIYETLESLIKRGIVMFEEVENETKIYIPLPVEIFLEKEKEKWDSSYKVVEQELKKIQNSENKKDIYVSTLKGEENIISFCKILIRRAKKQVMISLWDSMYSKVLQDLIEASNRGCSICGITFDVENPMSNISKHRQNKYMRSLAPENWFIISIDSSELVYGHAREKDSRAFYTDDNVHTYLMEDYIWHDVLVNKLIESNDQDKFDSWILPEMEDFFGREMVPKI